MALSKVTYVDGVTIIGAKNLNDIQDELIRQGEQQTADEEATAAALALKADKATTYTKTEVDSALALKADKSDTYTKAQVDASLALKADKSDTYTKAEVDASLDLKADKSDTYTKTVVDGMIADAIAEAVKESEYSNFEMKSVSGDFIHITDGAGLIPVKDLKIGIEAVQSGSGDPSPENIRPISGWTGAKVSVIGANQWDEEWERKLVSASGVKVANNSYISSKNAIHVEPNTSYCFLYTQQASSTSVYVAWYDANGTFISRDSQGVSTSGVIFTSPENADSMEFCVGSAVNPITAYNNNISINYPSTDTDYHAYDGHVYEVTWQTEAGTVYGGTLDVTTGELTVTHELLTLAPSDWGASSSYSNVISVSTPTKYKTEHTLVCDVFKGTSPHGGGSLGVGEIAINTSYVSIFAKFATQEERDAWLVGSINTNILMKLATPVTYTIDPTEVLTLLGENNIFADTGAVEELIYRISRQ